MPSASPTTSVTDESVLPLTPASGVPSTLHAREYCGCPSGQTTAVDVPQRYPSVAESTRPNGALSHCSCNAKYSTGIPADIRANTCWLGSRSQGPAAGAELELAARPAGSVRAWMANPGGSRPARR